MNADVGKDADFAETFWQVSAAKMWHGTKPDLREFLPAWIRCRMEREKVAS